MRYVWGAVSQESQAELNSRCSQCWFAWQHTLYSLPLLHCFNSPVPYLPSNPVSAFCLLGEKPKERCSHISIQFLPQSAIQSLVRKREPTIGISNMGDLTQGINFQERRGDTQFSELLFTLAWNREPTPEHRQITLREVIPDPQARQQPPITCFCNSPLLRYNFYFCKYLIHVYLPQ